MINVLSRERFLRYDERGRPVCTGFVTYVSENEPILMHRSGREDYSDAYDECADKLSYDNGKTWSPPVLHLKGYDVEGGKIRYGEQAGLFDPDVDKLIVIVNKAFYQDRENGDIVLFLTRYAERSREQWMLADYYRYRIALD